jgi:nucleotide-binding universal stress UspA family protein
MKIKHILCPTDFSRDSEHTLAVATSLAKGHEAELHIVHVYQEPFAYVDGDLAGVVPPADLEPAREQLAEVVPPDDGVRYRRAFIIGNPTFEIVEYAERNNIDLVVMGTHGWTGLSRLLMGSVAESVVRRAPCPVLTIKQPVREFEEST